MKLVITFIVLILIGGGVYLYIKNDKEKREQEEMDAMIFAGKVQAMLDNLKEKSEWEEQEREFENEMLLLLNKTGYTIKQAVDTIIAMQDKRYLNPKPGSDFDSIRKVWYLEHRPFLLTWPQQLDSASKGLFRNN